MGYRQTDIGLLVRLKPFDTCEKLRRLRVKYGTWQLVAGHLGVDYRTLGRWLTRLEEQGLDPRRDGKATRGSAKSKKA